jgi:transposase-like zinc ribbon protein
MPRNRVQHQKGLSDDAFERLYPDEEACRKAWFAWRWPEGFKCPRCAASEYCEIRERQLLQCRHCRYQTSLIAGTILQGTKLPMRVWFRAMHLLAQGKKGLSNIELGRRLCAEAKDGQIPISARIATAVEGSASLEEIGDLSLKGLSQAVDVGVETLFPAQSSRTAGRGASSSLPPIPAKVASSPNRQRLFKFDGRNRSSCPFSVIACRQTGRLRWGGNPTLHGRRSNGDLAPTAELHGPGTSS